MPNCCDNTVLFLKNIYALMLNITNHIPFSYYSTSDAERRATVGQSGGLYDAANQQMNLATLPKFGNAPFPYHLPQDVVFRVGDNRLYGASFHQK